MDMLNRNIFFLISVGPEELSMFVGKGETQHNGNNLDTSPVLHNAVSPVLTAATKSSPERYIARIGDTFRVFCEARGNPEPSIVWSKDGKPIDDLTHYKGYEMHKY